MAHFARIDNDTVSEVLAVKDCAIGGCVGPGHPDYGDPEAHEGCGSAVYPETGDIGEAFLQTLFPGTEWRQTSYSGAFRGRFAGVGYGYDPVLDEFTTPE